MAEYIAERNQSVLLNAPVVFDASIPCQRGYIFHEDGTGIFTLKGAVNNSCGRFARYQVTFNGNIAVPTGGTVGAIAVSIAVNGEPRLSSRAIVTPAAVEEFNNVTSTAIITVPKGCCFSLSLRAVAGSDDATVTPVPVILVDNGNMTITRVA